MIFLYVCTCETKQVPDISFSHSLEQLYAMYMYWKKTLKSKFTDDSFQDLLDLSKRLLNQQIRNSSRLANLTMLTKSSNVKETNKVGRGGKWNGFVQPENNVVKESGVDSL